MAAAAMIKWGKKSSGYRFSKELLVFLAKKIKQD
jgi:hypothetical protein